MVMIIFCSCIRLVMAPVFASMIVVTCGLASTRALSPFTFMVMRCRPPAPSTFCTMVRSPKATGKKETISGYETEEYVSDSPKFHASYWVATKYPDYAKILDQMAILQNRSEE